jgi:hypothetical protein
LRSPGNRSLSPLCTKLWAKRPEANPELASFLNPLLFTEEKKEKRNAEEALSRAFVIAELFHCQVNTGSWRRRVERNGGKNAIG